jgi:phytoene dehydrogenase-like protein
MTDFASVLVVGGGHNGLVCATYLAKAGLQVQILEAADTVGGGASTHSFAEGYQVSGLAHILHSLNPKVCKDLALANAGLQAGSEIDTIALDAQGRHLTLTADTVSGEDLAPDQVATYAAFKQEFRAYAAALEPLTMNKPPRLKDMDFKDKITLAKLGWKLRFGLGAKSMSEFLRVGGINIFDVLNDVFEDPRIKGAISVDAVLGQHMGPRTPTTVLTYLNHLRGETYGPQTLPPGGMGQVSKSLAEAARNAGVRIRTGAKVQRILVSDGQVTGVKLESGEQIESAMVVSNADAKSTFLDLVGAEQLDAMFAHRVHNTRARGNVAKLHLALDGLPRIAGLSERQLGQRLLIAPDMRYVEHAFNHAKYGEYSERPILEMILPSLSDPSLAPEGKHVMSVSASFAPYELRAGWDNAREAFADKVIALIGEYAEGFASQVIARELLTPVDIEQRYHVSGGHWHHGELAIDQLFMMRPVHGSAQYDTPVTGLFLCGASAHPGGGITGIPGHNAAQRILATRGVN